MDASPLRPLSIFWSAPVFNPSVYLLEVHGMECWHTLYINISTSQQDTQSLCPNRSTEDTAFSTFMLLVVLNFDQSSVKYTLQNTENYCHQWLSDSSRVHKIRFLPYRGFAPDPTGWAYDAPPNRLVNWGRGYLLSTPQPRKQLDPCDFGALLAQTVRYLPRPPQLTHFPKTEGTRIDAVNQYLLITSEP